MKDKQKPNQELQEEPVNPVREAMEKIGAKKVAPSPIESPNNAWNNALSRAIEILQPLADEWEKMERVSGLYSDLIMEVHEKIPDQSCHETARLRLRAHYAQPTKCHAADPTEPE